MCEYVWVYRGRYGHVWVCKSGQVENQKLVKVENCKSGKAGFQKSTKLIIFWKSGKLEKWKVGKF